jgi:hypothetical protein
MSNNKYDIYDPPKGHLKRFQNKFENQLNKQKRPKASNLKWYLIAASLVLIVSLWNNIKPQKKGYELADVSAQMKETQDYFNAVIQEEVKKVNLKKDDFNAPIIDDSLYQINKLEKEYLNLSVELKKIGFEKRIINAMIFNFQQRIEILQNLLNQLNEIKTSQNENNSQV